MSPTNSTTCKLPIVGSDLLCIVHSEWSSKSVKLLILHDNKAWSGKFQVGQDEDTAELLDQLSMTEDDYFEETKRVLTTPGGAESYAYSIASEKFTWKKYVSQDMAIKIGFTLLEKVSSTFTIFEQIIDKFLQENGELNLQLKTAVKQNESFAEENNILKTTMSELMEKKAEMESSLYSQFLYLLNEKKRRIKELQQQCQPSIRGENKQDLFNSDKIQSDSDPFGSDTEVDSEREEKQVYSKVESRGSESSEEEHLCVLPKRLRTLNKKESTAGPSGVCQRGKSSTTLEKSLKKSYQTDQKPKKSQSKGKKLQKFSCVIGKPLEQIESNCSEEDVFNFPKRSKRISTLVKPSTSKMKYDSDDEVLKTEIDSDSTPSGIEPREKNDRLTAVKSEVNSSVTENLISDDVKISKTGNSVQNKLLDKFENNVKNELQIKSENSVQKKSCDNEITNSEATKNPCFKNFSTSTLDILNQLI